jgi:S-adenosylmethionine-diacylgycerolhomoserine-N-methlytransferase
VARHDQDAAAHMDGIYRHQRYIYDATRKYFLLGRDRLISGLAVPAGGSVLEIGCGTGRNLILAARAYPAAQLYGFDISRVMLDSAHVSLRRAGLADRVRLAKGDATGFSGDDLFGVPAFDRIFISYALSMIPPWRAVLPAAMAAVRPGGELHIVDFGRQAQLPGWFRRGLRGWLARFSVVPRVELEAELRRLANSTGATLTFERLYREYADYAVLRRPLN